MTLTKDYGSVHQQGQTEPPLEVAANGSEAAEAAAADGEESRNRTMRQPSGSVVTEEWFSPGTPLTSELAASWMA